MKLNLTDIHEQVCKKVFYSNFDNHCWWPPHPPHSPSANILKRQITKQYIAFKINIIILAVTISYHGIDCHLSLNISQKK